jgi:predicted RNA-binding protein Jag
MKHNQHDPSEKERNHHKPHVNMGKIDRILIDVQRKLRDSIEPINLENLNGFERKKIHSFFDDKADYETKTYRRDDTFVLKVYPVGNLKRLAKEKAEQVLDSGDVFTFPYLPSYERFVIHNYLQNFDGVETKSVGENNDRRLEIRPVKFGRSLKRIIKKIKLF